MKGKGVRSSAGAARAQLAIWPDNRMDLYLYVYEGHLGVKPAIGVSRAEFGLARKSEGGGARAASTKLTIRPEQIKKFHGNFDIFLYVYVCIVYIYLTVYIYKGEHGSARATGAKFAIGPENNIDNNFLRTCTCASI